MAEEQFQRGLKMHNNSKPEIAIQYFRHAATLGHVLAQCWLGWYYLEGRGTAKDYEKALSWFNKSVENGSSAPFPYLGHMYEKGYGVKQDFVQAKKWYEKGAAAGNKDCKDALERLKTGTSAGSSSNGGLGEEWYKRGMDARKRQNYTQALEFFLKAAAQGHIEAQSWLGWMYASGQGTSKNYAEAFKWTSKAAAQGHAGAANNLGYFYRNGLGVAKSDTFALQWYRKAAEKGNSGGQFNYGFMYYNGYGVTQNYNEALLWFTKAAEQNYKDAFSYLGEMYEKGYGVSKNLERAKSYHKKGADLGVDFCKKALQRINESEAAEDWYWDAYSEYGEENYAEAAALYKKAAKTGHADAALELAFMYKKGQGVPMCQGTAGQWFRKAAELGNGLAQSIVGDAYYKKKKYMWAYNWYSKAADQGSAPDLGKLAWCFHHGGISPANNVACNYNEAIKLYKECESKLPDEELKYNTQYQIGRCYEFGLNNIPEARKWYQKAANNNYYLAMIALQQISMVENDRSGPESWFKKGESACWDISYFTIGDTTIRHCGYHHDQVRYFEAMRWWSKAAFYGHAKSQYYLALYVYQRGHGSPKSQAEALEWFTKAAERGYRKAQIILSVKYEYGEGAIKDLDKSLKWERIARQIK